jgi:hypothetical protein
MINWIKCEDELPKEDGQYWICGMAQHVIGYAFYDGWGFQSEGIYREPYFWAYREEKQKKYGKQK